MSKFELSRFKAKLKVYIPMLFELILLGEWTRERKAKIETSVPEAKTTPLASLPEDGQMAVIMGFFGAGVILAPILVPTQAEIDQLVQLLI